MFRSDVKIRRAALLAFILAVAMAAILVGSGSIAGSGSSPAAGPWRLLPSAPIAVGTGGTSVWTGTEMIVSGVTGAAPDGNLLKSAEVAIAYNPATRIWRRLPAPPRTDSYCRRAAVWTGQNMLIWGCGLVAFDPLSDHWRRLPDPPARQGIVVWTGREMIGWGGGCCGDADAGGAAYNPATNTWRKLAPSPLAAEQRPIGAWTGRELVLFVSGVDAADGKPSPARYARAAAYNPTTDTWRRIAPLPETRGGANAVWDGRELFVVGGTNARGAPATVGFAYSPTTNLWRPLPSVESVGLGASAFWTGQLVLVSGEQTAAYDPQANRWSRLPRAPLPARDGSVAVWTGQALIVFGGVVGTSADTPTSSKYLAEGAAFTPAGAARPRRAAQLPSVPLPACC